MKINKKLMPIIIIAVMGTSAILVSGFLLSQNYFGTSVIYYDDGEPSKTGIIPSIKLIGATADDVYEFRSSPLELNSVAEPTIYGTNSVLETTFEAYFKVDEGLIQQFGEVDSWSIKAFIYYTLNGGLVGSWQYTTLFASGSVLPTDSFVLGVSSLDIQNNILCGCNIGASRLKAGFNELEIRLSAGHPNSYVLQINFKDVQGRITTKYFGQTEATGTYSIHWVAKLNFSYDKGVVKFYDNTESQIYTNLSIIDLLNPKPKVRF